MAEVRALVAVMNNRRDWDIARQEHWYRIPVRSAPRDLRRTRYLAFYQTRVFGAERWAVIYVAPVLDCRVLPRRVLLPTEADHPRADERYYRLELGEVTRLPQPIPSRRFRRIVFIPTTWRKLQQAEEINDLFDDSPLEDVVWSAFKRERIEAERQYFVAEPPATYCLDFAIFCQSGQVDVECDGDTWHATAEAIPRDNERNNFLASRGWQVLRFGSSQINGQLADCVSVVRRTITGLGGVLTIDGLPRTFEGSDEAQQLSLW
jgi:very-short-patch-repair endonuclease